MNDKPDSCYFCGVVFPELVSEEWHTQQGEPVVLVRSPALYAVAETSIRSLSVCEPCLHQERFGGMADSDQAEILYQFGLEYRDKGRTSDSVAVLESALQHSRESRIMSALAFAYDCQGQRESAIRLYQEAVALDPNNGMAVANLDKISRKKEATDGGAS